MYANKDLTTFTLKKKRVIDDFREQGVNYQFLYSVIKKQRFDEWVSCFRGYIVLHVLIFAVGLSYVELFVLLSEHKIIFINSQNS